MKLGHVFVSDEQTRQTSLVVGKLVLPSHSLLILHITHVHYSVFMIHQTYTHFTHYYYYYALLSILLYLVITHY